MNKLLWMRCFVRVVETGSFSAVARELDIGQPNVSRHIAALEADLGALLLHRSTRQLVVTPEGQRYYAQARQALDLIGQAEADVLGQHNPRGLLRVSCSPALGTEIITATLPVFLERYPDIELDLRLDDGYVDLVAEGVDVAIRGGELKDSALRARLLGHSERLCVASAGYVARHGVPAGTVDLARHQCIVYTLLGGSGAWRLSDGEVHVRGRLRVNSLECVRRAALDGLGIGYLPRWMVDAHLRSGALVDVLAGHPPTFSPVNAVYSAARLLPLRASVFIDHIAGVFALTPGFVDVAPASL
jgi:DNA-binding transcriptional LysR family regulator